MIELRRKKGILSSGEDFAVQIDQRIASKQNRLPIFFIALNFVNRTLFKRQ